MDVQFVVVSHTDFSVRAVHGPFSDVIDAETFKWTLPERVGVIHDVVPLRTRDINQRHAYFDIAA